MTYQSSYIDKDHAYGAQNYKPAPVVLAKSKGCYVWDEFQHKYLDFVGAYSASSLGHNNKKILKALCKQASRLDVTSRAFYNNVMPDFLEKFVIVTGFDKALMMNSGAEAVETALKIARKWGEKIKKVAPGAGEIICAKNNFHGRTLGTVSLSTEPQYRDGFGPFLPGIKVIDYGDTRSLVSAINENTVAFIVEPIQGEAGIILPPVDYLKEVSAICKEKNVLLICDEIQTGLSRTGALFCFEHSKIRPDLVCVGKALGGGVYPVSAVLANNEIMNVIGPGDHGSTFGGNPIACAVASKALSMLSDPSLIADVKVKGDWFLSELKQAFKENQNIKEVRGKGLFLAIEFKDSQFAEKAVELLRKRGLLTKETHKTTIRLAPPLNISKKQLKKALAILISALNE